MMFAAPPEQSLEWSDSGIDGAHRFLKKLWDFAHKYQDSLQKLDQSSKKLPIPTQSALRRKIHEILLQANNDMQRLQFNTVVSAAMKLFNLLQTLTENDENILLLHEGISILLRILTPITPHITHELWINLGMGDDILNAPWPEVVKEALITDSVEMIVQINGKLRSRITVPNNAPQNLVEETVLADSHVQRILQGNSSKKIIIVPNKLVNIVI